MSILLAILKIIGIILLVIIGIILLIILLVLFCPIRYRIKGEHNEDTTAVDVTVKYLLVKAAGSFMKGEGLKYKVKLLFLTIMDSEEDKKKAVEEADGIDVMDLDPNDDFGDGSFFDETAEPTAVSEDGSEAPINNELVDKPSIEAVMEQGSETTSEPGIQTTEAQGDVSVEKTESGINQDTAVESTDESTDESNIETVDGSEDGPEYISVSETEGFDQLPKKEQKKLLKEEKKRLKEEKKRLKEEKKKAKGDKNITDTIDEKLDQLSEKADKLAKKIDHVDQFLDKPFVQKTLKRVFKIIKRLFGTIKPKKSKGYLKLGLSSPASTGDMLARLAKFYPLYGSWLVIEPDFYHKVIEGNVDIKGRIYLFRIVGPALRLLISRDFWRTYKLAKKI